jgi:channel protein (hemolysin III family)
MPIFAVARIGVCEPIGALSHLAAAVLAFAASVPLVRLARGNRIHTVALTVYATCVVALLAISGVYHSLFVGPARTFMQHADYLAIWLLIAGSFTAIHGLMCRGFWRRWALVFVWAYAAIAMALQVRWFDRLSGTLGLALYLGLGWLGLVTVVKVGRQIGFRATTPLWGAGLFFSVGAVLEACRQPVIIRGWMGPHETFHFAVIAGVLIHWIFIRSLIRRAPV